MSEPVGGDPTQVGGPGPTAEPGKGGSALTGGDPAPAQAGDSQPQKPAWAAQLPKDQQSDPDLTKYATIGDVWKGLKDLAGKAGKPTVPGEGATAEEVAAYRKARGVPEKVEDYQLEVKDLPEGMKVDENLMTAFKAKALEMGLNPKEAQELFSFYNANEANRFKAAQDAQTATIEGWKTSAQEKWGANYDNNLRLARRAFSQFGSEALAKYMDDTGLGEHPDLLEAFRLIGAAIVDSKLLEPAGAGRKSDAQVMFDGN